MRKYLNPTTYILLALFGFNLLINLKVLQSGYFNDDMINSQVPGVVPFVFDSIFDLTKYYFSEWIRNQGRFFPLAWYGYYVFDFFDTLIAYKLYCIFFITVSNFVFGYFVYQISQSKELSYLVILITPVLFQYRLYHDPILSYGGLMQLILIYTILSLILLVKYLKTKNIIFLVGSVMFYLFSLLTYEITYTFFLLHVLIVWRYRKKTTTSRFGTLITILP